MTTNVAAFCLFTCHPTDGSVTISLFLLAYGNHRRITISSLRATSTVPKFEHSILSHFFSHITPECLFNLSNECRTQLSGCVLPECGHGTCFIACNKKERKRNIAFLASVTVLKPNSGCPRTKLENVFNNYNDI